jgi:hypothetical protein
MATIVDDENVEQPNGTHADKNRFFDPVPVFEDVPIPP